MTTPQSLSDWRQHYGEWALVTGAARGIGKEFARQCAQRKLNLVLIDRRPDLLEATAQELQALGVKTLALAQDLGEDGALERIMDATQALEIGVLVNNAAVGLVGPVLDIEPDSYRLQVRVCIEMPLLLTRHFGRSMRDRGRGAIFNVSSRTGELGHPYFASYSAVKAWMTNFSEAIWFELKSQGIDVFVLKPDQTATPGYLEMNPGDYGEGIQPTENCVADAFEHIGQTIGRIPFAPGREANAALMAMPREEAVATVGSGMEQVFGKVAD